MSAPAAEASSNPAGRPRRSISGQGGLISRMFGSSNGNGKDTSNDTAGNSRQPTNSASDAKPNVSTSAANESRDSVQNDLRSPTRNESPAVEKKRRSSGVGRARDLFSSAKASLHNLGSSPENRTFGEKPQTSMQKLGRADPALSVPQGSFNNSAGESVPSPRSTFRVGVTEDKNKKCRRTMEDTHAYLYKFLSTPAPALSGRDTSSTTSRLSQGSSQNVVETDNGYFSIFDGHAGNFAADWCGKKVHLLLEDMIRKHPNTPIPELLDMTFTSVDQQLEKLPLKNSGCTAVTAVLRWEDRIPNPQSATGSTALAPAAAAAAKSEAKGESDGAPTPATEAKLKEAATRQRVLYTANVGDARIVLCRNGKALRLSYDHKGSDENEGKRIAGAGGLILNNRVNGVLAVTRALGDAYMKDLVTGHPYTTETVIQPDMDEFLILACDGVSKPSRGF
jgi:protein phosphatase PTC1